MRSVGRPGLLRAEEFAGAAEFQIHLGNVEAVGRFDQRADALPRGVVQLLGDQDAVALRRAAAHPAAELVELGEAEALGLLDHHHGGVGNVHADLDYGGGHQDLQLACLEALHDGLLFVRAEAAVHQTDRDLGKDLARKMLVHLLRGLHRLRLGFLDHRVDDVRLAALVDLALHETVGLLDPIRRVVFGEDGLAAGRKLVDDGDVEVAIEGHGEGAGDGGRGHHEDIGGDALARKAEALEDAETVLLVDDGEAEALELDVLFEDRVGADHDVHEALGDQLLELLLLAAREGSGEQNGDVTELLEDALEIVFVLVGEDLGGREHGDLVAVLDGDDGRLGGHDGLAAADVALEQAVHRTRLLHIVGDLLDDALLGVGGLEG